MSRHTYEIGDTVYLKTDLDQLERIITEILIKPGCVVYLVVFETSASWHYDFELSLDKDIMKTTQ